MGESLTLYQATDAMLNTSAQLDSLLNYWLSGTFTVVLATFLIRQNLNLPITIAISCLYLLGTIMIMSKAGMLSDVMSLVIEHGPKELDQFDPYKAVVRGEAYAITRISTYILGFVAAQSYLWLVYWNKVRGKSS